MAHSLGQCNCGQYHLTVMSSDAEQFLVSGPPPHWMKSWHEVETPTSYEGKHRSE